MEKLDKIPMAMIVDSPWIPGYLGIKHMDYFLDPELWFQSNKKINEEFPDIIMVPSWWMEYGMAAEPSALGAKIKFWADNTPSEYHTLYHIEDLEKFPEYEVENDAFMAMTLHRMRMHRQRIADLGEVQPFVTSRGPMCTAGFVRGTTDLMIDLVEKPEWAHKLLDLTTRLTIDWLKAQVKAMGNQAEGIFILDDIVGFVNEEHYKEFCHPYLKRICDAFPADWGKRATGCLFLHRRNPARHPPPSASAVPAPPHAPPYKPPPATVGTRCIFRCAASPGSPLRTSHAAADRNCSPSATPARAACPPCPHWQAEDLLSGCSVPVVIYSIAVVYRKLALPLREVLHPLRRPRVEQLLHA